jgi:hypothetical protein
MTLVLPHYNISLDRIHDPGPGALYQTRIPGGVLSIREMPHRDRDRFVATLIVDVQGVDAGIEYTMRAPHLSAIDAALTAATRSPAGANALTIMSFGASSKARAA